jgi:hypothetical protein
MVKPMGRYTDYTDYLSQTILQRDTGNNFGFDALADIALFKLKGIAKISNALNNNNVERYKAILKDAKKQGLQELVMTAACANSESKYESVLQDILAELEEKESRLHSDKTGLYGFVLAELTGLCGSSNRNLYRLYERFLYDACRTVEMHEGLWFRLMEHENGKGYVLDTACSALMLYAILCALRYGIGSAADLRILAGKAWQGVKHNLIPSEDDGLLDVLCTCGFVPILDDNGYLNLPGDTKNRSALGAALLAAIVAEHGNE